MRPWPVASPVSATGSGSRRLPRTGIGHSLHSKFIGRDEVTKGIEISGFIGTLLLYHILPTIDYPAGQLVRRRKSGPALAEFEATAEREGQTGVPFWLAADHLMVTWARAGLGPA